jgi:hypothetical protein
MKIRRSGRRYSDARLCQANSRRAGDSNRYRTRLAGSPDLKASSEDDRLSEPDRKPIRRRE